MYREDKSKTFFAVIGLLSLAAFLVIVGPLLTLWGWNQLFGDIKMIKYSFDNWLAVAILGMFIRGIQYRKAK